MRSGPGPLGASADVAREEPRAGAPEGSVRRRQAGSLAEERGHPKSGMGRPRRRTDPAIRARGAAPGERRHPGRGEAGRRAPDRRRGR